MLHEFLAGRDAQRQAVIYRTTRDQRTLSLLHHIRHYYADTAEQRERIDNWMVYYAERIARNTREE